VNLGPGQADATAGSCQSWRFLGPWALSWHRDGGMRDADGWEIWKSVSKANFIFVIANMSFPEK
jgi:hypothetical protein